MLCCKTINNRNLNSNDKRQQAKGRKTEYFLGNGMKVKIPSEIKPPLKELVNFHSTEVKHPFSILMKEMEHF